MSETHAIEKEREVGKKGPRGSSWEYEDCRSLRKRDLMVLDGLYAENGLDSTYLSKGRNRPYRKRDCGYWDFEQSEPNYMDYGEANEIAKDCMLQGGRDDGYRNPENVNYETGRPGMKDNWLSGSPEVIRKAGGYENTNGYIGCKDLNYNPENLKRTQQWTNYRNLDDSLGNLYQPQKWYMGLRNFNYSLEDCKDTNLYYRDLNNLYHVPRCSINGQFVDLPDLSGVNGGKEFFKYHEEDRSVYQNDKSYPNTKAHAIDQGNSDTEYEGYDTVFANCEHNSPNYRGTDFLHQIENLKYNGIDRPGNMALRDREIIPDGLQNQYPRGEQGENHFGISQSPSLEKNTWYSEEERTLTGPETWRRNSCFRRTAPSTLRRSEFVQNRKKPQGRNSAILLIG